MENIRKYLPFILLFLIPLAFYHQVDVSDWISSSDFHTSMGFGSSLLSITAGIMVLLYFFTTGSLSFLILSVGFVLIGTEEFFQSIFLSARFWPSNSPSIELAISTTWLAGNFVMVTSFLLALLVGQRETTYPNRIKLAITFSTTGFIIAAIFSLIIFNAASLPVALQTGSATKKVIELALSALYFVAFIFYLRLYQGRGADRLLIWNLIAFLAFRSIAHIYAFDATRLYDAHWDMANVFVFLSSLFPIFGIWMETLKVYRASQQHIDALKNEIEEHKLATKALTESEEDFRRMFESNSAAMILIDDSLTISMVNDKFCSLTGLRKQEAEGMDGSRYVPGRFMEKYLKSGFENLTGQAEVPDKYELTFYRNDFELKHVYSTLSVLNNKKIIISFVDITERKLAEEELIKSEERFKHIFSSIKEVIYSVDYETREFRYLSPSFEMITGYSNEDIIKMGGRSEFLKNVVDTQKFREWDKFLEHLYDTKEHNDFNYETLWICKDGTQKYLNDHWIPVFRNGKLDSTQGVLTDITERKQAELSLKKYSAALAKLNQFALRLSKLTGDGDLEALIVKHVKEVSGAAMSLFAVYDPTSQTLITTKEESDHDYHAKAGEPLADSASIDRVQISDQHYRDLTKGNIINLKDLRELENSGFAGTENLEKDQLSREDRCLLLPYMIEGELHGVSLLMFTNSQPDPFNELLLNFSHLAAEALQRNRVEAALKESEKKYRSLVTNIPGAVFHRRVKFPRRISKFHQSKDQTFDNKLFLDFMKEISVEYFSERVEEVTGYSSKHFMDQQISIHDLMHEDDRRQTFDHILRALTAKDEFELEYRIKHRDGSWHWILERGMSYYDHTKDSLEIDGILFDTTDRKQIEIELVDYAYTNQELKQFAYIASHQLQEPIRTVSNYTKIIEEDYAGKLDEGGVNFLHTIRNATDRMAVLINTLLEFSQIGRNKKLVSVDFMSMLDSVITDLMVLIKNSEAVIEISEMPVLKCYEVEIRQLFHNLIINAIKFQSKDHPPIVKIRSEKLINKWKFSVTDNGIGIDAKYFEKIFDIFQRLHLNEDEYEGKGIGLAYCKKIVQLHHGEIWVESEPGAFTTFYFTLPVLNDQPDN